MSSRLRVIRAVKWGAVGAAGIALGLLFGARTADVSPDRVLLAGFGLIAAGLGSIAGLLWPVGPLNIGGTTPDRLGPEQPAPPTDSIDLRDPAIDLRTPASAGERAPVRPDRAPGDASPRRTRPLRPRTPPG